MRPFQSVFLSSLNEQLKDELISRMIPQRPECAVSADGRGWVDLMCIQTPCWVLTSPSSLTSQPLTKLLIPATLSLNQLYVSLQALIKSQAAVETLPSAGALEKIKFIDFLHHIHPWFWYLWLKIHNPKADWSKRGVRFVMQPDCSLQFDQQRAQ